MPEVKKQEEAQSSNMRLFVGGLHEDVSTPDLQQRFGRFGSVSKVDVRTKRDCQGQTVNVFAYMDIVITEANFKKCLSTYNDAKWKGHVMRIQVAKESFLTKLAAERKERLENKDDEKPVVVMTKKMKEQDEAKARLEDNMKKAGIEDFIMKKSVPGTPIPGEENWIVGKFGRVLPIMHMRRRDNRSQMTYDPSKYGHYLRKFKEDAENDQLMSESSVTKLTWQLPEKQSAMDRKRMGEFPDYVHKKRTKMQLQGASFCSGKPLSNDQTITDKAQPKEVHTQMGKYSYPKRVQQEQDFEVVKLKPDKPKIELFKLKPVTAMDTEREAKRAQVMREQLGYSGDVGEILAQCKLESDNESCGSADTDEICTFSNKKQEGAEKQVLSNWADDYYHKERVSLVLTNAEYNIPHQGFLEVKKDSPVNGLGGVGDAESVKTHEVVKSDEVRTSGATHGILKKGLNEEVAEDNGRRIKDSDGLIKDENYESENDEDNEEQTIEEDETIGDYHGDEGDNHDEDVDDGDNDDSGTEEDIEENNKIYKCHLEEVGSETGDSDSDEDNDKNEEDESDAEDDIEESNTIGGDEDGDVDSEEEEEEEEEDESDPEEDIVETNKIEEDNLEVDKEDDSSEVDDGDDDDVDDDDYNEDGSDAEDNKQENNGKYQTKKSSHIKDADDKILNKSQKNFESIRGTSEDDEESDEQSSCTEESDSDSNSDSGSDANDSNKKHKTLDKSHDSKSSSDVSKTDKFSSVGSQGKSKLSDKIRLESVKKRQAAVLSQKAAVQEALKAVDSKRDTSSSGRHVRFDEDEDDAESGTDEVNTSNTLKTDTPRLPGLFDSDDEDGMEIDEQKDDDRFKIKPQFHGKAGEKLMKLQDRFGADSRFKLGENFMEEDDESDEMMEDNGDDEEEKQRSLAVLEGIVGSQAVHSLRHKTKSNFRDPSQMRYDPSRQDHTQFEIHKEDTSAQNRKMPANSAETPEVPRDKYYEVTKLDIGKDVSENQPFSFFGDDETETEKEEDDEKGFGALQKDILASSQLGKRQLTLDSSDNESDQEEVKHDGKNDQKYSTDDTAASNPKKSITKVFFFQADDVRLQTGPQLFCRKLSAGGLNQWFEQQKADLQGEYKKRHQRALRDSKKANQPGSRNPHQKGSRKPAR